MAAALTIIGGVVSAVGAISQGNAAAAAADYNARVAERNRVAVIEQTYTEIEDQRAKDRKLLGAMRAAFGANGFEMSGSPLDVMSDTITEQNYDVAKQKYVGRMKAQGYSEQATLYRLEKKSAKSSGIIGAATSLIGGFTDAFQQSSQSNNAFALG